MFIPYDVKRSPNRPSYLLTFLDKILTFFVGLVVSNSLTWLSNKKISQASPLYHVASLTKTKGLKGTTKCSFVTSIDDFIEIIVKGADTNAN